MRILTFTSLFPNARQPEHGVFIYQRVSHLAKRAGIAVEVIAPVPYFPKWLGSKGLWAEFANVPAKEVIGGLTVHHPRYPLLPKVSMRAHGGLMYRFSRQLARQLFRATRFDCVDGHYVYPDGYAATLIANDLGIPAIVSARGTDMNFFPQIPAIRPKIQWTLQGVAGGIGVSLPLCDLLVKHGLDREKVRFIGNGVDTTRFFPIAQVEARRKLGIPEDRQVLVSVAALKRPKGFPILLPTIQKLRGQGIKPLLYMIGRGEEEQQAKMLARSLDISDQVTFVGPVRNEDLSTWYSAANASVLASSREGWPNVLLESMACGTPVVATNVGGIPGVLNSADLGILAEPDVESVCTAIGKALNTPWDRRKIADYGSKRSWEAVAAEVEEFFQISLSKSATYKQT